MVTSMLKKRANSPSFGDCGTVFNCLTVGTDEFSTAERLTFFIWEWSYGAIVLQLWLEAIWSPGTCLALGAAWCWTVRTTTSFLAYFRCHGRLGRLLSLAQYWRPFIICLTPIELVGHYPTSPYCLWAYRGFLAQQLPIWLLLNWPQVTVSLATFGSVLQGYLRIPQQQSLRGANWVVQGGAWQRFQGWLSSSRRALILQGDNYTAACETSFKIDFFTEPQNPRRESCSTWTNIKESRIAS